MKLTQERLKEILHYNPNTGIFIWQITHGRWNRIEAGSIAGNFKSNTYTSINIDGVLYQAHRLAFLYMEGYFPEYGVDHKNRIKSDNWWDNLRESSKSCNARNSGNSQKNKSGVKGLRFIKKTNKYRPQITINNITHRLSSDLDSMDEAVCHRLAGEQCLDWSNCAGNSPAFQYVQKMLEG